MKASVQKSLLFSLVFLSNIMAFAQPSARGGAGSDDNEWIKFLIIGLVVGAILGFLGGKYAGNSKK
ncbi:YhcB family protein [Lacihabitans soyangensis]|jgi:hypothetical protein|uniref:LPXTG cell wall anchor domain-containing protein n=1 Tax=Lacihabitans soyangensis TaxID=869394 RepID=A0AAE3KXC2_9BACT|nr:YhcB family protein [Lacihabitans soyangensis]MCP9764605.1 hypothetical protein [Lacihabitans soyangensis]HLO44131.1 YhcB family protein [Leadbetterella sp.]